MVCARIEGPVANVWLLRKIEGRADAEVSAAAAIDEVVHRASRAVAADFFLVILEVMGVAGHGNFHVAARQEAIERGETARRVGDIPAFCHRRSIVTAREAGMADDGHGELPPAAVERALEPCPLPSVDAAQDAGVDRQQCEVLVCNSKNGAR